MCNWISYPSYSPRCHWISYPFLSLLTDLPAGALIVVALVACAIVAAAFAGQIGRRSENGREAGAAKLL
jgi:hypothetical protein